MTQPPKCQTCQRLPALLSMLIILALLLAACQPAVPAGTGPSNATGAQKPQQIKIAILPIVDALPLYVATKQLYFSKNNIDVTFVPAASAAERDQLIVSGQADGMINDLVSVGLYNKQSVQVQTVRFAMVATEKMAMFRVLAAQNSGLKTAADLAGVPVGMSQGTVIDYVTSRLLEKEGLAPDQIKSVAVPKLPDRLALLGKGEIKAATLPEPFGTIAQQAGAVLIVDDTKHPEYGNSVFSFRKVFIDQHPDAVKGFLAAVEQAVQDINKSPDTWRPLLGEYKLMPHAVQASFPIPVFPDASVPSAAQWNDVVKWMQSRELIANPLPYSDSITDKYLPMNDRP